MRYVDLFGHADNDGDSLPRRESRRPKDRAGTTESAVRVLRLDHRAP